MGSEQKAQRALDSIAAMLGWMNTPPQHVLETEIRVLKARAASPPPARETCQCGHRRAEHGNSWHGLCAACTCTEFRAPARETLAAALEEIGRLSSLARNAAVTIVQAKQIAAAALSAIAPAPPQDTFGQHVEWLHVAKDPDGTVHCCCCKAPVARVSAAPLPARETLAALVEKLSAAARASESNAEVVETASARNFALGAASAYKHASELLAAALAREDRHE